VADRWHRCNFTALLLLYLLGEFSAHDDLYWEFVFGLGLPVPWCEANRYCAAP
jgi:hypothetical protein